MCICNYEAKNETEACFLHLRELVYCLKPVLKVRMQTVFQIRILSFLGVMY